IGRYIYSRIHCGLYGKKQVFSRMQTDFSVLIEQQAGLLAAVPDARERLQQFALRVSNLPAGVVSSFIRWLSSRWQAYRL
ncbi:transcriptional regulator, partial [Candidatus Endoriftia persephone str. Guaymas]|nr:transcriptional regulator [Candidatus Endoriftia persephone str. Guaymas]